MSDDITTLPVIAQELGYSTRMLNRYCQNYRERTPDKPLTHTMIPCENWGTAKVPFYVVSRQAVLEWYGTYRQKWEPYPMLRLAKKIGYPYHTHISQDIYLQSIIDHVRPRWWRNVVMRTLGIDGPPQSIRDLANSYSISPARIHEVQKNALAKIRAMLDDAGTQEIAHE